LFSQNLQLHYDFRNTIDPKHNTKNFPTYILSTLISNRYLVIHKTGSFLFKVETDLQGDKNNIGKSFVQVPRLPFMGAKIFIGVQYSGGLGVTEPKQYSYYISNALSIGPSVPFQWKGACF